MFNGKSGESPTPLPAPPLSLQDEQARSGFIDHPPVIGVTAVNVMTAAL